VGPVEAFNHPPPFPTRREIGPVLMPLVERRGAALIRIAIPSRYWKMKTMEVEVLLHLIHPVVVLTRTAVVGVVTGDPPHPPTIDLAP